MTFDVVRGNVSNIMVINELVRILSQMAVDEYEETLYLGYPLSANINGKITVDALLVSERYGIVAFIFSQLKEICDIKDEQDELYFQFINTLTQYPGLRKGRNIAFDPIIFTIVHSDKNINDDNVSISTLENIESKLKKLSLFDSKYFRVLVESLQKIATIKPRKKRQNIKKEGSKGDIIKKIEKEIANLDLWQKKAAMEIVDGPQRIRGLAGSGKTIVSALKAAYLHAQNPDWNIVITYYTRSLFQQYRELITRFVYEFSKDEPNWDKLQIMHAWGTQYEPGVYSDVARTVGILPVNFTNAKNKYGSDNAFRGICDELIASIDENSKPLYDIILIDEAQDMPASFFKIAYKSVDKHKRIVWAYDELQNLSSAVMPSIEEMFGVNDNGEPFVELKNQPNEPLQDIILPVCYRNPPWVLALAHSLGFGIYHKPLVQHFQGLELWEDIGYKVEKGTLDFGKRVVLTRKKDATPEYFERLLNPEDVIVTKQFENIDEQYHWIAKQIKKNIFEEELDPDDILVIFPSALSAKNAYQNFNQYLYRYSIPSMMAGVTHDRDIFKIPGYVSCSAIYRAKGNESPMVYIVNSNYCFEGFELIKLRNILFTAITRSRAWVRICGIGDDMKNLIQEVNCFSKHEYALDFKVPTLREMQRLRIINRERNAIETKKIEQAKKGMQTFIELLSKGDIDVSQIPELSTLMKICQSKNDEGNIDEENE